MTWLRDQGYLKEIREQDPLKQGLKLLGNLSPLLLWLIREQDPLKQGLNFHNRVIEMNNLRPPHFSLKYTICAILSVILPFHFLGNALPAILLLASIAMVFVTLSVLNSNCNYIPGIAYAGILSSFWLMTGIILLLMGAMDLVPEIENSLVALDLFTLLGGCTVAPALYTFYLEYRKIMWI